MLVADLIEPGPNCQTTRQSTDLPQVFSSATTSYGLFTTVVSATSSLETTSSSFATSSSLSSVSNESTSSCVHPVKRTAMDAELMDCQFHLVGDCRRSRQFDEHRYHIIADCASGKYQGCHVYTTTTIYNHHPIVFTVSLSYRFRSRSIRHRR